ncbi:muscle M-line assembly protein unc-89-like [Mizuhopecten yessoensis]|uniref:muscle M-line assembly protein unc-89-like n=1 Tax=Mizuhopecten yessoensis TaxID=6573 RepID=UPI000B45E50D|nr:muscle M-line assembly protein unc-89-like [Mizuhopecten yessoensis]
MDTENNLSATFPTKPHLTKDIEHVNSSGEGPTKPNLSSTDTLPSNLKHNVQDSSPEGLGTFSYQKSPNSTLGREHKKVVFADDISSHPTPGKVSEGECKQGEIVKGKNKQETVVKTGSMHVNEEKGKSIGHEKPLRKLVHQDSGKSLSKQDSLTKKSTNLEKGGGILYKGEIVSSFDRKADRKLMKQDNVINEDMPTNKDLATDKASKKLSHKELVADNTSRELPQKEVTTDNVSRKLPQREEAAENVSRKLPQREEAAENVSRKLPQDVSSDKAARKGSVTRESPDKKAVQQELKKMDSFGKAEVTYPKRTGSIEKLQKLDLNTGSDAEKPVRTEKESEDKCKNELNKNRGGKNTGLNGGENMIGDIPYLLHRRHLEKSPEPVKTEEVTSPTDMDEIISNRRSRSLKKKRPSNMQVHQVKVYEGSLPVVPDKGKTEVKSPVSEGNSPVSPVSGGGSPCSDTSSLGSVAGSPVTPGSGVGSPVSPGSRGASPISPGSRGASPISPGSLQQRIGSRSPSGKRGYQSRSPSGKRTPSRTSNDRSPSCNRRMEIVNYHRLPHRDSFSSVDDTTSPTFEKDILKQIQNKENIKENDSAFSECNGEVIKDGTTLPPPLSVAKVPLSSHQASEDNKSNNNLEMVEDITVVQNKLNDNLEKRLSEDKLARKEATGLPTDSKMYGLPQHITQQVQHSYKATSDNPKMAKANNPSVVNACQSGDDPKNVRSSNPTPVSCQPGERGKPGVYISRPEPSKVGSVQTAVNKTSAFHMKNPDKKAKEPFSPVYRPTFSLKQSKDSALSAPKQEETQPKITTKKLNTDGKDNTSVRTKPALPCRKPALPGKKPEIMSKKPALPGKRQDQQTKRTNASRKADQVSLDFSSPAADFILSETDYASKPNRNSITFSTFKPPDSNSTSPRPLSLVSVDENEEEPSISLAADKDPTVRLNQTFHAHPPENVFRPSPKPKLKLGRHPSDQGIEGSKVNEPRKFHKERGYMYSFESVNDPPSAQMFLSGSTDTDVQGSPESVESVDMLEPLENLEENISDGSESSVSEGSNSEFGDDSEHECDSSDNDDAERHKEFLQFAKSLADSGKEITVDSGVGIELSDSGIKDNSPLDPLDQLETLEGSVYEDENQNLPPRNDNNGKRHYTNTTLSSSSDESYHERIVRNKRVSVDPLESLENPHIAELASLSGDSYSDECDSDDHMTSRHRLGAAIPILTISTASSPDDPHRSPSSSLDNEISQSNPS